MFKIIVQNRSKLFNPFFLKHHTMFSYFANRNQNIPLGILTIQQLHSQLVSPDQELLVSTIEIIRKLRSETDETEQKKIKGQLPVFTPGAQVDTKDKLATPMQKNIRFSGFMQVDIDPQDNPNLKDASEIRDKLTEIPYIALAAISARGNGVWGLLALEEPEKFTQYIEQVAMYFRMARITIDKSKSKNPTELRYFSPDQGAILKNEYKLFPLVQLKSNSKPKAVTPLRFDHMDCNSLTDIQRWVTETTGYSLTDGQKHNYLFWLSYALRKNGVSEIDVFSIIYANVLSADLIKSNCISGGISHANLKGIYTPSHSSYILHSKEAQPTKSKSAIANIQLLSPNTISVTKHNYLGSDGLLYTHQPGLPDII
jgi:hypothetical protein